MYLATTTADFNRFENRYVERIRHVFEAGFSYIDLCLDPIKENDELFLAVNRDENIEKIKDYALENGIKFVQAHGPSVNPLGNDTSSFVHAVKTTERAIEICGELGIPNIVVHPGYNPSVEKKEWFEKNREFFRALFPAMEKHNVNVLHENTTNANMRWYFSKTGAEMREFSEFVNHPMFHSCWDTGHANIEGSQYNEILTIGDDLYAVHINDNRGHQDEHVIPFFGTLNMDEIMNALKDVGYRGCFTLEACSTLRPSEYWLGSRHEYPQDTRLSEPPLILQKELEKFMYSVGEYILKSYDCFEK